MQALRKRDAETHEHDRSVPKRGKTEEEEEGGSSTAEELARARQELAELKRQMNEKSSSSAKTGVAPTSSEDQEFVHELSHKRRVTVKRGSGRGGGGGVLVDIREFFQTDDGEWKHGRKGITLTLDQWKKLLQGQDEINRAIERFGG